MIELRTEMPQVRLKQLSTHRDDLLYFNTVELNRDHLSKYDLDTSDKYPNFQSVEKARLHPDNLYRLRMGIWVSKRFAGSANFTPNKEDLSSGDIGFWLAESRTGFGFATVAVNAIAQNARFSGYRELTAHVQDPANEPAIAVLGRAGFAEQGFSDDGRLLFAKDLAHDNAHSK